MVPLTKPPPTIFFVQAMFWSPVSLGDPKKIAKNPKCLTASSVPAPQKSPDPNRKGSSSNRLVFRGVHFIREATESGQLAVCLVGEIVKIPSPKRSKVLARLSEQKKMKLTLQFGCLGWFR